MRRTNTQWIKIMPTPFKKPLVLRQSSIGMSNKCRNCRTPYDIQSPYRSPKELLVFPKKVVGCRGGNRWILNSISCAVSILRKRATRLIGFVTQLTIIQIRAPASLLQQSCLSYPTHEIPRNGISPTSKKSTKD